MPAPGSDAEAAVQLEAVSRRLLEIDAYAAEARAAAILAGLSFDPPMQRRATKTFSGGWRMRVALARWGVGRGAGWVGTRVHARTHAPTPPTPASCRALFVQPDILLLDEPTNHLDLHAVLWLEDYLVKRVLWAVWSSGGGGAGAGSARGSPGTGRSHARALQQQPWAHPQTSSHSTLTCRWPKTLVVVSHARSFLNAVCTDVLHLHSRSIVAYKVPPRPLRAPPRRARCAHAACKCAARALPRRKPSHPAHATRLRATNHSPTPPTSTRPAGKLRCVRKDGGRAAAQRARRSRVAADEARPHEGACTRTCVCV